MSTTTTPPDPTAGVLLLDLHEVGRMLGVSGRCVWKYMETGRMPPPIRIGGKLKKWRAAEIREWVAAGCPAVRADVPPSAWAALRARTMTPAARDERGRLVNPATRS
jgi:predicted DNA-binding transcriptional regulator AlpA